MEKQEPEVGKLKKDRLVFYPTKYIESFFLDKIDRKKFKNLKHAHKSISFFANIFLQTNSTYVFWTTFLIGTTTPVLFSPVIQLCECCIIQPISMLRPKTEKNLSARI